jgi:FdrA protein
LAAAVALAPEANWVLVSTPGRYAAAVGREALGLNRHLFLYSDNVPLEEEVELKRLAARRGLLMMGPDCGTAVVNGVGLGFANRVRRGPIGLVGASGTGLQQVMARIHQLGSGITHALGTGGRDLSEAVGAITARQGLDLLVRDPDTQVIVLISKPPAPSVASGLLAQARRAGKPVIVHFVGEAANHRPVGMAYFAGSLDETAELAVWLAAQPAKETVQPVSSKALPFAPSQRYVRGLYSGGTLAYEAQRLLLAQVGELYANAPLAGVYPLARSSESQGHTIVDLGEDEFTVGRLHPMLDNELRVRRLLQEAADPETAVVLLDVVLGDGAHPNPAGELAPAIAKAHTLAQEAGRHLQVIAVVVGTEDDPQGLDRQLEQLAAAGAEVTTRHLDAVTRAGALVQQLDADATLAQAAAAPVDLALLRQPVSAINVGLASFADSLTAQGAAVVHTEWRPPAGGNEKLMGILARMKQGKGTTPA